MSRALAKFGLFPSESEIARRLSQEPVGLGKQGHRLGERTDFRRLIRSMGGRYWPACTAWWNKRYGLATVEVSQPDGGENLDALA